MARDLEKKRAYDREYRKKKFNKEKRKVKAAKQRAYRLKKKSEKMAANENSDVNGFPITPPLTPQRFTSVVHSRAGSSPLHSIANNGVTNSDERLNMLETRLVNSAKAKRSHIALLKETLDKFHETVDKANDQEDEATARFFRLIAGDNQNRFEKTEIRTL